MRSMVSVMLALSVTAGAGYGQDVQASADTARRSAVSSTSDTPIVTAPAAPGRGVRLIDLADIEGVRDNAVEGIGLVVGLKGTGDQSQVARQVVANFITKFHLNVDPKLLKVGNAALVRVSAVLPPFVQPGQKIDASVQSILDAESLFGGDLVQALLYGPDGKWYAAARGPVSIGGFDVQGQAASVTQNHPLAGRIPGGATVERPVTMPSFASRKRITLLLKEPSFVTARRCVEALESLFPGSAHARDGGAVDIEVPPERQADVVGFVADLSDLRVVPHTKARVVINEKTGTVVVGEGVTLREVSISHGNLTVKIAETPEVSQPEPLSRGQTTVVPRTQVEAEVQEGHLVTLPATVSVKDLAEALNTLGVTPRDLVVIFQMLHSQGALNAELVLL